MQTINARHNPHYRGQKRGATWLNKLNDQAAGPPGKSSPVPRVTPCTCWTCSTTATVRSPPLPAAGSIWTGAAELGGHPAGHRLHSHGRRPSARRDPDALPRRPPHPAW
ncbi:hypothetical protein REH65_25265 [Saccharopolyspora sp. ID03-671]|uniref:hypothetical protein n=1 Tax=Saccharopolyspora sp. ID03-671 TaxID=3073066 RepID=UPI00325010FA